MGKACFKSDRQIKLTLAVFRLNILCPSFDLGKCSSINDRNALVPLVVTLILNDGLKQVIVVLCSLTLSFWLLFPVLLVECCS